jgi:hypothetical protein
MANDLIPINVIDLTAQTIPYWELCYLLIDADRINP